MTIVELLNKKDVFIQGHHTRLIASDGEFEVLAKHSKNSPSSSYSVRYYLGRSEQTAVEEFLNSEEHND